MASSPILPPLLTGHPVAAGDDLQTAVAVGVAGGRFGAGDLVWSEATDVVAAALVLEPEGSLAEALQMVPLTMVAIADALGAIGPPRLAVTMRWPDTLLADGAAVGRVSIAAPPGARLDTVPEHVVVGFSIALALPAWLREAPGRDTTTTALHEEGCGDVDRDLLIGAVARHFLSWLDTWSHEGFAGLGSALAERLSPEVGAWFGEAEGAGARLMAVDATGAARVETATGLREVPLARALGIGT